MTGLFGSFGSKLDLSLNSLSQFSFIHMDGRLFFPATQRNMEPIGSVLAEFLPKNGMVLEVASGSGEHALAFQRMFPNILWQASDQDPANLLSIRSWIKYSGMVGKMPQPIHLNIEKCPWHLSNSILSRISAIVAINLTHVSAWNVTKTLFMQASEILTCDMPLILYGPFKVNNAHISDNNSSFDLSLRSTNTLWGIRNLETVIEMGYDFHFENSATISMPANNLCLIFRKAASTLP